MKKVVEQYYVLTPEEDHKHIEILFTLDENYEKLHVHFSYSPKWVEEERALKLIEEHLQEVIPKNQMEEWGDPKLYLPLENLITLSVDYNKDYVGSHHCKDASQQIVISESGSTKGFIKYPINEGDWCAKLSLHCVQSEKVHLQVEISVE